MQGSAGGEPGGDAFQQRSGLNVLEQEPGEDQIQRAGAHPAGFHGPALELENPGKTVVTSAGDGEVPRMDVHADQTPGHADVDVLEAVAGRAAQDGDSGRTQTTANLGERAAQRGELVDAGGSHVALVIVGRDAEPRRGALVLWTFMGRLPHDPVAPLHPVVTPTRRPVESVGAEGRVGVGEQPDLVPAERAQPVLDAPEQATTDAATFGLRQDGNDLKLSGRAVTHREAGDATVAIAQPAPKGPRQPCPDGGFGDAARRQLLPRQAVLPGGDADVEEGRNVVGDDLAEPHDGRRSTSCPPAASGPTGGKAKPDRLPDAIG